MNEQTNTYNNPLEERESKVVDEQKSNFLAEDEWMTVDISNDFLDFTKPYTPPRFTLRRGNVGFGNVGDLHIISGKPGNGKTGLMAQFEAAILGGEYGGLQYALKESRPEPKVLHIDTEQSEDDTIAFKNRVCTMSGLDFNKQHKNFIILRLRDTEREMDRWRKVIKAINEVKPTDIFLDGALDLVRDYNDQTECQPLIRKCMMTATEYDASIWMVLHENPMINKLVGTLGSIAQRKVTEVFSVEKTKQSDLKPNERKMNLPNIYFTVNQLKARGKDVGKWYFEFIQSAGGWGVPSEIEMPEENVATTPDAPELPTDEEILDAVRVIGTDTTSFSALRERIKKDKKIGSGKAEVFINLACTRKFLIVSNNKYKANPADRFHETGDYEMPF